jgi:hypothetical protein
MTLTETREVKARKLDQAIIQAIYRFPLNRDGLVAHVSCPERTLNYHLRRLRESGYLEGKIGKGKTYRLTSLGLEVARGERLPILESSTATTRSQRQQSTATSSRESSQRQHLSSTATSLIKNILKNRGKPVREDLPFLNHYSREQSTSKLNGRPQPSTFVVEPY